MSYCERANEYGMGKMIKGSKLHEGNKSDINRTFEMRIHLKERIVKVSDYPKHENICELIDKNLIDDNK